MVLLVKLIGFIMFRLLRMSSHAKMKFDILKALSNKSQVDYSRFVNGISKFKRDLQIEKSKFDLTILATAAPNCYAEIIAKNANFDVCLATNYPNSNFNAEFENSKEIKKINLINYLAKKDIKTIDTFVTDHMDDLPIMKLSTRNMVVNPNRRLENELKRNHIDFEVIQEGSQKYED